MSIQQTFVRNLESFIVKARKGIDKVLLPRQLETFEKIKDFLAAGYISGHVVKPTGIGKTVIFSKFLEAALLGTDIKALVVGTTKINLHQNRWKLDAFADIAAGAYYTAERDLSRQVTVTTYHSLRNLIKTKAIDPKDYGIVILDEAHRGLGEETIEAIDSFAHAVKIGFTATPEFSEERSIAHILPFLIDEMSVREAIEADLLAGLQVFAMTTGLSMEHVEIASKDFEERSLTKTINTPERNRFIAELYRDDRFNGKRAIIYAATRTHGKDLTAAFEAEGIKIAYIDGLTPEMEREMILERFKTGEIKALCNVRVLVESFDEPEAEICINATPTLSKVIAEQRGGRVLRRSRVKDSKIGYVVEIIDEFGGSANTPVLYSEIAGAAEILAPSNRPLKINGHAGKGKPPKGPPKQKVPGELIDDPKAIMGITNRNKRQRFTRMFEYAPRGWVHTRRLAYELKVKESAIRIAAEGKLGSSRSDWFKRYLTPMDILVVHYHPELANLVRRHFVPDLQGMVTPAEYAQQTAVSVPKAEEFLNVAAEQASRKAIRFADEAYFPAAEPTSGAYDEQRRMREEEQLLIGEAEELFWADDERSDEEREHDYWDSFEDISTDPEMARLSECEPDPLLHGDETDPFDDDVHVPLVQDEPSMTLSPYMRRKVRQWIELLPDRYSLVVRENLLRGQSCYSLANELNISGGRTNQIARRSIRLLGSRSFSLFMWEYEAMDDDMIGWTIKLSEAEAGRMSDQARKTLKTLVKRHTKYQWKSFLARSL